MAEHLPYYGHEQGCYNSKIPWGPEPCSGCVSLRRAFSQGQRDEREACIAVVEAAKYHHFPAIDRDDYDTAWDYVQDCLVAVLRAREEKPHD